MELWVGAINLGFLYGFMAMGVFITFRIHDFPDITVDGSFTTGGAVAAVLLVGGVNPLLALLAAFVCSALAGALTGLIHTRFNINGLLSGILVMTGLYSVNLHLMGRSNIPLLNQPGVVSYLKIINPGLPEEVWFCLVFFITIALFWFLFSLFFKTDLGITMRATGNNAVMAGASGVNVNAIKIMGISLANGLVGISGAMVAQYQGFADIGMGIGSIVFGMASVIIGESILKGRSIYIRVMSVIIGSVLFRLMVALALYVGLNPIDLKLMTATFVLAILIIPKVISVKSLAGGKLTSWIHPLKNRKRVVMGWSVAALAVVVAVLSLFHFIPSVQGPGHRSSKVVRIGIVQFTENAMLNLTRDSFLAEMKALGYEEGKNCLISLQNANGDLPTVNTILDKFLHDRVDIIVPISTACTQAAINKISDRPIVFGTVANPFIIGAGKSETDHLPNVTGVYGAAPVDKLLEVVTRILPGKVKVGGIWDPAEANSVYNVDLLKKALSGNPEMTFVGATISGSSEVYQAALSLTNKGIDAFVLVPDHIVFSAFESVVKAARTRKIPIFMSDVERLKDGALAVYGYDYSSSGVQAAHLVDRVVRGETIASIPFEKYSKATFGINMEVAKEIGIVVPPELLSRATSVYKGTKEDRSPKRLALFLFSDNILLKTTADGVMDELKRSGLLDRYRVKIDLKNAQNDFTTAQAIVQDIVRQRYDYIITVSTPALQATANGNRKIPHIFGAVTDPYRMGIAKNAREHIPNITGVATFQPVESTVEVMREIFPKAKRLGMIWNPAEANSEACTLKARDAARKYDFELLEKTVSSTDEVKDALSALLNKKIDLFFTSGDNTVILALETIAEILKKHTIPYFTNMSSDIEHGAFVSMGADYYEVGVETAKMAGRVIGGEDPAGIPIRDYVPEKMGINLSLVKLYGLTVPDAVLKKAVTVKR